MKYLISFILGWTLNTAIVEYRDYEYYKLTVDALDQGHVWNYTKRDGTKIKPIDKYVEAHRTKILDYITYRPNLYTCQWLFEHNRCLIKSLLRKPIPLESRPKLTYE